MKSRNLTTSLMLLVLAAACFVSVPVSSGEHPWDADDPIDHGISDTLQDDSLCGGDVANGGIPEWWLLITNTSMFYITGMTGSAVSD